MVGERRVRGSWDTDGPRDLGRLSAKAFDQLIEETEPFLRRYVSAKVPDLEAREDVIGNTRLRLLGVRDRDTFQYMGFGAWIRYVQWAAHNCVVDYFRAKGGEPLPPEEIEDVITDGDGRIIEILAKAWELDRLYEAADELWLSVPRELSRGERDRRLLAAQLYYLHGTSWEEVADLLWPVTREELDEWLAHEGTRLALSYHELYRENDVLCAHLLQCPSEDLDRITKLAREEAPETPPGGWAWSEVRVIVWRYRNGLLTEQILRFDACQLAREELDTLFHRCRERFPFAPTAHLLLDRVPDLASLVNRPQKGFWRRLVFQYYGADELPQKQIFERLEPAVVEVGTALTEPTLNAWLSNGRIFKQLAAYLSENP